MLVISNHVKTIGLDFPNGAVVRINVAWLNKISQLHDLLRKDLVDYDVWVDYPTGRNKPPKPTISLTDTINVANEYKNVKYFAFSNAEDNIDEMEDIRNNVREDIKLVPKIESVKGIDNLEFITKICETDVVMFDKEDLYTDLKNNGDLFRLLCEFMKMKCDKLNIKCLMLKGVIFSE